MKEEEKNKKTKELAISLIGWFAFILVYIIAGSWGQSDIAIIRSLSPYALWLGIALFVFYQFLFVANSRIAKAFKGDLALQLGLAALMAFFVYTSSIEAANNLNRVFGVDASAFPNALRIMTLVQVFLLGKPLFWALLIWSIIAFAYFFLFGDNEKSWQAWIFSISGITVSGVSLLFIYFLLGPEQLSKRTYVLARATDFYSNVNCAGRPVSGNAVFLGPEQQRILVDDTKIPEISWIQAVTARNEMFEKVQLPSSFATYSCTDKNTPPSS
ncbi:hypothetical protein D3C81_781580 [compost metagenome]